MIWPLIGPENLTLNPWFFLLLILCINVFTLKKVKAKKHHVF